MYQINIRSNCYLDYSYFFAEILCATTKKPFCFQDLAKWLFDFIAYRFSTTCKTITVAVFTDSNFSSQVAIGKSVNCAVAAIIESINFNRVVRRILIVSSFISSFNLIIESEDKNTFYFFL